MHSDDEVLYCVRMRVLIKGKRGEGGGKGAASMLLSLETDA